MKVEFQTTTKIANLIFSKEDKDLSKRNKKPKENNLRKRNYENDRQRDREREREIVLIIFVFECEKI